MPLVFVLAVLVNSAVLFVSPVVAPRLATLPAVLFAPHAFAKRNVVLLRVLVWVQTIAVSAAFTVNTLPANAVALPVQVNTLV